MVIQLSAIDMSSIIDFIDMKLSDIATYLVEVSDIQRGKDKSYVIQETK